MSKGCNYLNLDEAEVPAYPEEVQKFIDFLDEYKVGKPDKFHIFHLYPRRLAYPEGFYDSRFFDLHCFNTDILEKHVIEDRDGLIFNDGVRVDIVRIFADGSTLIRFKHPVRISIFQAVEVYPA